MKGVRYVNLPVDPELRRNYQAVLKNEDINWRERLSPGDIPDVICTKHQLS